ncbi:MAG: alpha-glucuronidase family glycosyl hydrolase [Steroidobacteraceae bacterium]
MLTASLAWLICLWLAAPDARAEDGHELWLRYHALPQPWVERYRAAARELVMARSLADTAQAELARGLAGLLGAAPTISDRITQDGAILIGTPQSSASIATLNLGLEGLGSEGFVIRSLTISGHRATVIAANTSAGVIFGVFHFLRLLQTLQAVESLALVSVPQLRYRVLDHWDNLDGTVERGYAGASIWDWHKLPGYLAPRYLEYARACASIGINGTVVNNVNADPLILTPAYLEKLAALAGVLRPYGIKVYIAARFAAPIELGALKTADPLDPAVRTWWQHKVEEIYRWIPDFGGFLVKANSEGQPGPQDYGRSHADGANLFAEALAPHGGVVMWRAFVYSNDPREDRIKQAFNEFAPLDGRFRDNVLLQVKNGPLDFQPREPVHPLFGAMPRTPLMLEVEITKEYLGFATHLAYLGPLYEEALNFDTYAMGAGSTVRKVIDGSLQSHTQTGIAGVSNVGADRNWTGSDFDQANWYVFGRLAWDPSLSAREIAEQWVRMTFSNDAAFVGPVVAMMMGSREAVVDYMTPLGLAHLMASGHHYGPGAWQGGGTRADWTPPYFHRADADGIGFDRGTGGSNAVAQYAPPLAALFNDPERTPEKYLLWFHHLRWDRRMASGATLWDELVLHYTRGWQSVQQMRHTWAGLQRFVDAERYSQIAAFLAIQDKEARWWRDATLAYFQSISGLPFPPGTPPPQHTLDEYKTMSFPYAPGNPGWTAAPFADESH